MICRHVNLSRLDPGAFEPSAEQHIDEPSAYYTTWSTRMRYLHALKENVQDFLYTGNSTLLRGLAAFSVGLPAFSEAAGEGRKGKSCSLPRLPLFHKLSVEDDADKRPGLLAERSNRSSTVRASLERRDSGLGLMPIYKQPSWRFTSGLSSRQLLDANTALGMAATAIASKAPRKVAHL